MSSRGDASTGERPLISPNPRSLATLFPIGSWLRSYRWRQAFPADLVAGIALAALLIPESMGYAGVAGVAPEVGLYAALGALFAYAITGGVSILVVGPASAVAALSASLVAEFSSDVDPLQLTAALAISSGVVYLLLSALRMGWIVNFISRPVLHAFIAGLSISIIVGQLDGLLGLEVSGESVVAKMVDIIGNLGDAHGLTVVLGLGSVLALIVMERVAERVPAAVLVVAFGVLAVVLFDLADRGVDVVGDIPTGLPSVGVPDLSATRWIELLGAAMALVLVGFSEGFAAASSTADETGEPVDADQELLASGTSNVAAGLVGGLAVSGSLSKSAASARAGARSQVANLVAALIVLLTLVFLAPLFEDLPESALAAIVIVAVLRSADPRRVVRLWAVSRTDFIAAAITFVLVLVWETLPAMIVGVTISLLLTVRRSSFPDVVELRRDSNGNFRRFEPGDPTNPPLSTVDGVALLRFEAPLIYSNANRLVAASDALCARRPDIDRLVIDGEMFSDLDTTGAEALERLDDSAAEQGIDVHLARLHVRARAQAERSGVAARFEGRSHPTVHAAIGPIDDGPGRNEPS